MMRTMYHATDFINLPSIMEKGLFTGCDGVIYLCEKPEESLRFIFLHGIKEVLVVKVLIEEKMLEESFDHNEQYFGCKAYTYGQNIGLDEIDSFLKYK